MKFEEHSASWQAGYKEGWLDGGLHQKDVELTYQATQLWLLEQDRIDREMWIWTQGVLIGCLLVVTAYWMGKV